MSVDCNTIVGHLKFLKWQPSYEFEKPFQVFINVPDNARDKRTTNLVFEDVAVEIGNLRHLTHTTSLDQHGFIYRKYKTHVQDLTDRSAVETSYLSEVESILRQEVDGADRIFFFDWRVSVATLPSLSSHGTTIQTSCTNRHQAPQERTGD